MKILLDNCVHFHAKHLFRGHELLHAREMNWRDLENGKLLAAAAEGGFDLLITVDKNMRYQHNIEALPLPVVELNPLFTRLDDIKLLVSFFDEALTATERFLFVSISPGGIECLAARK